MSEAAETKPAARTRLVRAINWFVRLPAAAKGVITTVEFGLAVGCVWAAWTAGGDMALIIPALTLGLFFAVIGIATIPELKLRFKLLGMSLSTFLFLGIGGFLYWHFEPKSPDISAATATASTNTQPVQSKEPPKPSDAPAIATTPAGAAPQPIRAPESPPSQPPVSPTPAKPKLVSTFKRIILVCDSPKAGLKSATLKEKKAELARYIDLMEKVFGYSVKGSVGDDELSLSVTLNTATGPLKENYLIKREGDKLFVSVTTEPEANNALGFFFGLAGLAPLSPDDDFARQMKEKVEQLIQVEPGKCKLI